MNEENRKDRRYPLTAVLEVTAMTEGGEEHITMLSNNISRAGLGVRSFNPSLKKNTPVSVSIIKMGMNTENNRLAGTVAWSLRKDDLYYMGISLSENVDPLSYTSGH
jgi:hypothetical protein